jgi:hypothetical protein
VTSSGTATSKIVCFCVVIGDELETTAQSMPIWAAIRVWVPVGAPEKLPTTVLAEQSPAFVAVKFSVVGTARSMKFPLVSLLNTVNGNENLALFNGMAGQVAVQVTTQSGALGSSLLPSFSSVIPGATPATTAQLPVSQQVGALKTGSGLLFDNIGNNGGPVIPPLFQLSGLLAPIPYETTKAQLETGGGSANRVIFDLSGPVDGKPGETLVAWVLTLPQELTFAKRERFEIVSQSREDLVQNVEGDPDSGNNPLMRKIAYNGGSNNNPDYGSIGTSGYNPCTFTATGCLMVKFQPPGLGAHDSINFSTAILRGDA